MGAAPAHLCLILLLFTKEPLLRVTHEWLFYQLEKVSLNSPDKAARPGAEVNLNPHCVSSHAHDELFR